MILSCGNLNSIKGASRMTGKNVLKIGLVLAAALVLMNPGPARADIFLMLTTPGTPMGADFLYTYEVVLMGGTQLVAAGGGMNSYPGLPSNNFFTLYDVQGLVA